MPRVLLFFLLPCVWYVSGFSKIPSVQENLRSVYNANPDPGFELLFSSNLEELSEVEIKFEHPLPKWLRGTLVRNGLGRFEIGPRRVKHAFDGFSKLYAWKFYGNGSATFSTKFLLSEFYSASVREHDIAPYLMFEGVDPPFDEVQKLLALAHGIDNMNVNVYDFYNNQLNMSEYVAVNDFWKVYQFDIHNLSTVRPITAPLPFGPNHSELQFLSFLSSAHPLPESGTNHHLTFVSSVSLIPGIKSFITLVRIKSAEEREEIAHWTVDKVPYMHSFSVTQNYAILFASPFYVNVLKMIHYAEPIDSLDWYGDEDTTVYVVELKTGNVKTLKTENIFCMHHINAYENDSMRLVLDMASYESPTFVKSLEIASLRNVTKRNDIPSTAMVRRYMIDMVSSKISSHEFVSSPGLEFVQELDMPAINEHYRYRKHCYIYGIVLKSDNFHLSNITVVKKDVCRPYHDQVWYVPYHYPVEAWFVPIPGGREEDDGYLMTPVLNGLTQQSYLAVIDAKTMKTVNNATLPLVVPFTLHGRFFANIL